MTEPVVTSSPYTIWLRRVRVMTAKELLQLFRDIPVMLFLVYAFTMDIYLAGSGVSLELTNGRFLVHDADHSAASRELIYRLGPPSFRFEGELQDSQEGAQRLDRGQAMMVLDIPPQFQESLAKGEQTSVQLQVDTTNAPLGLQAASYSARIVGQYGLEASLARLGISADKQDTVPILIDQNRVWYNPNQNETWFMSVAELLTIITVFALALPGTAMVREKERGTVEQLLVSPLTPFQIMFPKVVAMTMVILIGAAVSVFVVLEGIFHVPMRGSLVLFFAVAALYVLSTAGLGLFAATIARNQAEVGLLIMLILAPMLLLSGIWTPPEAMPEMLRYLMAISPLYYFIDISYGIFLKGSGLDILWESIVGMAVIGSINFSLGMWRFRKQFQ
jgi:ABC-2 type transport system permease protein